MPNFLQDDNTPYCEVPNSTFSQLISHPMADQSAFSMNVLKGNAAARGLDTTAQNIVDTNSHLTLHHNSYLETILKQNGRNLMVSKE